MREIRNFLNITSALFEGKLPHWSYAIDSKSEEKIVRKYKILLKTAVAEKKKKTIKILITKLVHELTAYYQSIGAHETDAKDAAWELIYERFTGNLSAYPDVLDIINEL